MYLYSKSNLVTEPLGKNLACTFLVLVIIFLCIISTNLIIIPFLEHSQ